MEAKDILTLAIAGTGAMVALGSLIQATVEYVKRGRLERLQVFFDLRRRLKERDLAQIAELIDEAQASSSSKKSHAAELRLSRISLSSKRDYLGLFEEVGLAMEKGLIEARVAHYMFGYYALHCRDCDAFWVGVSRLNPYWDRFYEFCEAMEVEREVFERERKPRMRARTRPELPAAVEELADEERSTPRVVVRLPPVLQVKGGGLRDIEVHGETVGEVLEMAVERFPDLRWQIFCKGSDLDSKSLAINHYLNVYYNDEDIDVLEGLETPVVEGASIILLPASSGG